MDLINTLWSDCCLAKVPPIWKIMISLEKMEHSISTLDYDIGILQKWLLVRRVTTFDLYFLQSFQIGEEHLTGIYNNTIGADTLQKERNNTWNKKTKNKWDNWERPSVKRVLPSPVTSLTKAIRTISDDVHPLISPRMPQKLIDIYFSVVEDAAMRVSSFGQLTSIWPRISQTK